MNPGKTRPDKASIELTHRATNDLREIESYSIREWGRKTANKYLDEIAAALDRLGENPGLLSLEPAFSTGLFFYRVKKHFLVCDFQSKTILVLAVIHTSMDLPERLLELEPRLRAESQMLRAKLHPQDEAD